MIQSSSRTPQEAACIASSAAFAPSVNSLSSSAAYASDSMPALLRSLPIGIPNARSTSSEATTREPIRNPDEITTTCPGFLDSASSLAGFRTGISLPHLPATTHRKQDFYLHISRGPLPSRCATKRFSLQTVQQCWHFASGDLSGLTAGYALCYRNKLQLSARFIATDALKKYLEVCRSLGALVPVFS